LDPSLLSTLLLLNTIKYDTMTLKEAQAIADNKALLDAPPANLTDRQAKVFLAKIEKDKKEQHH